MPGSRSRQTLVVAGCITSTALLLGSAAVVKSNADEAWQQMVARGESLRAAWQARSHGRLPLWGEASEGRAFDHYGLAAESIRPLADANGDRLRALLRVDDAQLAEATAPLRSHWQQALTELHLGAHARDVAPRQLGHGEDAIVSLLDFRWLTNAAMFEARLLRQRGDAMAAVECSLDALTLAADCIRDGVLINQMVGSALLAIVAQAWPDDALRALPQSARDAFAAGLARLDAMLPNHLVMDRELLFMAETLQKTPDQSEWCGGATLAYGFSQRWLLADAFLMMAEHCDAMASMRDAPWPERERAFERTAARVAASNNLAAARMFPHLSAAEFSLRRAIVELRLLRTALDVHRGVDLRAAQDPFGNGPLDVYQHAGNVVIQSVGQQDANTFERFVTL